MLGFELIHVSKRVPGINWNYGRDKLLHQLFYINAKIAAKGAADIYLEKSGLKYEIFWLSKDALKDN